MGLKLNTISDKLASDNLDDANRLILQGDNDYVIHPLEIEARAYFRLAANHYKLESPKSEIIENFRKCGETYLDGYEKAGLPGFRSVNLLLQRVLPCVYCFCPTETLTRFARLEEWQYCWPPTADAVPNYHQEIPHTVYPDAIRYLRQLLRVIRGESIEPSICNDTIQSLKLHNGGARPWIGEELSLGLKLLLAIDQRSQQSVDPLLRQLLALHKRRATRGDLKSEDAGLLSLHGLLLAKMALQMGMDVDSNSDYLPVYFFDGL